MIRLLPLSVHYYQQVIFSIIHFKTNLQVIICIIHISEPDNNFKNHLKPSNGISNNYLIVTSK